jgi:hypothetical protein
VFRLRLHHDWQALATAALALFTGFLLVQLPVLRHFFDLVAMLLATTSAMLLRLAGFDMLQTGIEIRDTISGHAIAVTSACDGHGLLISLAAAYLWLGARAVGSPAGEARAVVTALAVAVGAILLFNLIRILTLFLSLGALDVAEAQHVYVAPLLSVLLVAGLGLYLRKLQASAVVRSPFIWLALALVFAGIWFLLAPAATCSVVVPVANALLWLLPGRLTEAINCAGTDPAVITSGMLSASPLTVLTTPFQPSDFTLALPLVFAALALGRKPAMIVAGVLTALGLFALAMVLGAVTLSHDQASTAGVTLLAGRTFTQSYAPPGPLVLAFLKAAQNSLVHFNLFILPLVLVHLGGAAAGSTATPSASAPRRRRSRP